MPENEIVGPGTSLQPHVLAEFFENQKRELELKAGELQLKTQQDKHGYEHAQRVLDAQVKDRESERKFSVKTAWHRYVFVSFIVVASLVFLAVLTLYGMGAIAVEILKATLYLAAGGISGFFYGKNKPPRGNQITGSTESDDS